ncbi:hypothetical protein [uncultured Pseudoteredinibacter sp.]|uniref:hypothetical protein n=1 Tax=uncultured Pseudoteredinibacter sp. TaxID=1641701 RepID=UPI002615D73D|nr:hypothetical protein [uncultured Pseudoteredinibacter sp.]
MKQVKDEFKALILELLAIPSEERESEVLERLDLISPDPEYTDYIYHSDEFNNRDGSFDIDGYAEKVFSYKPIRL